MSVDSIAWFSSQINKFVEGICCLGTMTLAKAKLQAQVPECSFPTENVLLSTDLKPLLQEFALKHNCPRAYKTSSVTSIVQLIND